MLPGCSSLCKEVREEFMIAGVHTQPGAGRVLGLQLARPAQLASSSATSWWQDASAARHHDVAQLEVFCAGCTRWRGLAACA